MRKSDDFTKVGILLKSGIFAIPAYQRDFSWNIRSCETLAEDVMRISQSKDDHFLGSIVVMSIDDAFKGSSAQGDPENIECGEEVDLFHVVDGQQRLTACSLFLCALRDEIKGEDEAEGFPEAASPKSKQGIIKSIDRCLFNEEAVTGGKYAPRLFLNNDTSQQYQTCLFGGKCNANGRKVINAYNRFRSIIRDNRPEDSSGNYLSDYYSAIKNAITDSLKVDDICCDSFGGAFQIFESLNAKGMPLKSVDLIKCFMMQKAESNISDGRTQWNKLLDTVGATPDNSSKLDSFMNAYLFAKTGERVSKTHAYDTFKNIFKGDSYQDIYNELQHAAELYDGLINDNGAWSADDPRRAFEVLRFNSIYIPVLAFALHRKLSVTDKEVIELENQLKPFAIRYQICGGSSNALDSIYKNMIQAIEANKSPKEIAACLKSLKPSNEAFRTAFKEMTVSDSEEPLASYLLEEIELFLERSLNASAKRIPAGSTLEHVIPKEYSIYIKEWGDNVELPDSFSEEIVRSIGNLALIVRSENSSASNKPYSQKLKVYLDGCKNSTVSPAQGFNLLKQIADNYPKKFGIDEVRERSEELADQAVLIWS